MLYYFLLCLITIFTGLGFLRFFSLSLTSLQTIALAPMASLILWTIFLGWGVCFDFTVKQLSIFGWSVSMIFAILGALQIVKLCSNQWKFYNKEILRFAQDDKCSGVISIFLIFLIPIFIMWPYFWHDLLTYLGSPQPDGIGYISHGQFMWFYTKKTMMELTPFYQFASGYPLSRFISSALLGFFSPLIGSSGEIAAVNNLFLAWTLFVYASSCLFFLSCLSKNIIFHLLLMTISIVTLLPLVDNNYDNLLILGILPTTIALFFLSENIKQIHFFPGFILAALLFAYVEIAPFIFLVVFILYLRPKGIYLSNLKLQKSCYPIRSFITSCETGINPKQLCILIGVALFLITPYFPEMTKDFFMQFASSQKIIGARAGDGLHITQFALNPVNYLIIYLGLKGFLFFICGCLLFLAVIIQGSLALIKQRHNELVIITITFLIIACVILFMQHYAYGAYKIILLNWWLMMFIFGLGLLQSIKNKQILYALTSIWLLINIAANDKILQKTQWHFLQNSKLTNKKYFSQLKEISRHANDGSVKLQIGNTIINRWAMYYLRDIKIIQNNTTKYLLSDKKLDLAQWKQIWSNEVFYLFMIEEEGSPRHEILRHKKHASG